MKSTVIKMELYFDFGDDQGLKLADFETLVLIYETFSY